MPSQRASSNSCNISNEMPTYIGSNSADESFVWKDKGNGRLPASRTKTWWRSIVNKTKADSAPNSRKPRQLARMVKGFGTAGIRSNTVEWCDHHDESGFYSMEPDLAPIARVDGIRLAKLIGAKADKRNIKWHHALKLDQKMWPHGYKGRKPHKENFDADAHIFDDETDFTVDTEIYDDEEDFAFDTDINADEETTPPVPISLSGDFPALITTNPVSFKSQAIKWSAVRAAALHPLRVAIRVAKDADKIAATTLDSYTRAVEAARKADSEYLYRYRNRRWSRPIYYWASWEYARDKAIQAAHVADGWAKVMLSTREDAEKARQKVEDLKNTHTN